jgi:hypothetical protein
MIAFSATCGGTTKNPMLVCISAKSQLTAFYDRNASSDDIEESKASILSIIVNGMLTSQTYRFCK